MMVALLLHSYTQGVFSSRKIAKACERVNTNADCPQLLGMVDQVRANLGRKPAVCSADAGFCSEANLAGLHKRHIRAYIATGRQQHGSEAATHAKNGKAGSLVIAWRIMLMTLLGRESPDLPAEILFSDFEIRVLKALALQRRLAAPTKLENAVHLVARLGGYLARKNDPPPGHEIMWRGFSILQIMTQGFELGAGG